MISQTEVSNKARVYSNNVFGKFYPEYLSPENFKLRSKNDYQAGYEQALSDLGLTQEYLKLNIETLKNKYLTSEPVVKLDQVNGKTKIVIDGEDIGSQG